MAEKQVTIRLSVTDNFSTILNKFNQAMGQAASDTQQFNQAASSSSGGIDDLTNAIGNAVKGFIAFRAVGMVSELVQIGGAANATQSTFTALSGGASNAAASLEMMRQSTGRVVSDVDLMAGSSRLLAMNIAATGEQAANLAGVAVNLGRAFGQDASSAIENFSLMIANQSLLRLDSLGISSSAVRERMAELKDEFPEMDKQARFTQATLEEATKTVDRLGTSITAAQTPIAQLETKFENLKTKVGQVFADILNTAITTFDQLGVVIEHSFGTTAQMSPESEQAVIDSATAFAEKWGGTFSEMLGGGFDISGSEILQRIEETRQRLGPNASAADMVNMAGGDMWFDPNQIARISSVYAQVTQMSRDLEDTNNRVRQSELNRFNAMMNSTAASAAVTQSAAGLFGSGFGALTPGPAMSAGMPADMVLTDFFGGTTKAGREGYASDKLYQFETNTAGMGKYLDPAVFDDIKTRFEELQQLNEQGLISDESLTKAEEFKNQAEAAANAFKTMSLTDIFGQTSGGMEGQIGDMVIAEMRKSGATDEQIAAAQRNFDLGSGRETQASLAMQEKVAPMIASLPPEQQQQAIENMNAFLEIAAKMNMNPQQIATMLPGAAGFTAGAGTGQSFSVNPGDTLSAIAAQMGIPVETLLAATGASSGRTVQPGTYSLGTGYAPIPNFNPATYAQGYGIPSSGGVPGQNPFVAAGFLSQDVMTAGRTGENAGADPADKMQDMEDSSSALADNMKAVADQLNEMDTKATSFNDTLDLAGQSREMTFTVNVKDNTKGLLELMLNAKQFATLSFATEGAGGGARGNGGRVQGVDNRVGQKPSLG